MLTHSRFFSCALLCCDVSVAMPEDVATNDPHLAARDVTLQVMFPESKEVLTLAKTPLRMTGLAFRTQPAPQLGQHNQQLLRSNL